jgi:hypothetical protein
VLQILDLKLLRMVGGDISGHESACSTSLARQ